MVGIIFIKRPLSFNKNKFEQINTENSQKEYKNFEEVEVKVVKAKLDSKGNKELEKVTSKNGKEYLKVVKEETTEKRQKDMPSRLNARRKIMKKINIRSVVYLIKNMIKINTCFSPQIISCH